MIKELNQTQKALILCLFQFLLPAELLGLLGFLDVLFFQELPMGLHPLVPFPDKSHQLANQFVPFLSGFVAGFFVLLLHRPFLPTVGRLSRVILFFPCKGLPSAKTLPVAIKAVDDLITKEGGDTRL